MNAVSAATRLGVGYFLEEDEPAPMPSTIKLAATPIAPSTASLARQPRYASAAMDDTVSATSANAQSMSYTAPTAGTLGGADQFLNGRGLY